MTVGTMALTEKRIVLAAKADLHRRSLERVLRANAFVVFACDSAVECIRLVRRVGPSAIVLDRHLVDGEGWPLIPILKQLAPTRDVPIVAISRDDAGPAIVRLIPLQCDAVVTKPCDPETVATQLAECLGCRLAPAKRPSS